MTKEEDAPRGRCEGRLFRLPRQSRFYSLEGFPLFLLPPLAGGSARVPCQINDLVGWVRKGDFWGKDTLTLTLFPQRRGEKKGSVSPPLI